MKILRLDELIAQGRIAGKRVFIRADPTCRRTMPARITGHPHPRLGAVHPHGAGCRRRGDGHLHLGRPTEGEFKPEDRWRRWPPGRAARPRGAAGPTGSMASDVAPGQVVMLENCRVNKGEKKNDEALARKMAGAVRHFVNDAFGTAHRAEGTTYGIAQFAPVACAGPLLAAEIDAITRRWRSRSGRWWPSSPAARSATKLTILQSLAVQGRWPDRRRRHRQHLSCWRWAAASARAWPRPTWWATPGGDRGDEGARRQCPSRWTWSRPRICRRRAGHRQAVPTTWPPTT